MKQIALMGLVVAVLAGAFFSCSGGADKFVDGGDKDHPDGSVASDSGTECDGNVTWFCTNILSDHCCGDTRTRPLCEGGVLACPSGTTRQCPACDYDAFQPWPDASIDSGEDVGQDVDGADQDGGMDGGSGEDAEVDGGQVVEDAGLDGALDAGQDAGQDGGKDGGTADTGIVVNCGPSPTGKGGDMCDVPAGPFHMGCNSAVDTQCWNFPEEKPYHSVNVPGVKIDKHEVTTGEYQACVDSGNCTTPSTIGTSCNWGVSGRENHPINCVDWNQAKMYCGWVGKRLPTEAEWEKAARGTDGRKYPWGNDSPDCDHAVMCEDNSNFPVNCGCGSGGTMPVGSKTGGASPYGVADMTGNVFEWVEDDWHDMYSGAPSDGTAWIDDPRAWGRVIRGGCWTYSSTVYLLRASARSTESPSDWGGYGGFRCALSQ